MAFSESNFKFIYFKQYTSFLLENHMEAVVDQYVKFAKAIEPDWLKWFKTEDEFRITAGKRLLAFYQSVLEDRAIEHSHEIILQWKKHLIPEIGNKKVSTQDILNSLTVRRLTNFYFINLYTSDVELVQKIYSELEYFYNRITQYTLDVFLDIFEEELQTSNEELKSSKEELQAINEELRENQEELQTLNEELREQIDQRIEIENALRVNEKRFRELFENLEEAQSISHVGSWEFNIETNKIHWSSELYRIFGYAPYEVDLDFDRYLKHIHPDFVEKQTSTIQNAIVTGQPYSVEHKIIARDGTEKWVLGKGKLEVDPSTQSKTLKGIAIDITESKRHEIEVTQKNLELADLLKELREADENLVRLNAGLEERIKERTKELAIVNDIGKSISSELDLNKVVQKVTDVTTQLTGAQFGAFFYNVTNEAGESYMLYAISGVPREAFSKFPMPRNTKVFAPTFRGEKVVRVDDITIDARYGHSAPHYGMPKGHLPVKSYMAVPVISRDGEVLGALIYGHEKPGIFTERSEIFVEGIASQAAIAIDNARLYENVQSSEQRLNTILESIPAIAWMADQNGEIEYFNQEYYNYSGKTFNQSKGKGWINLIHPHDIDVFEEQWEKCIATGEDFEIEVRLHNNADNNYKWQLCRAVALKDKENKVIRWFGTCTNINEQKQISTQLLETNRELLKVNEFLDTFVYIAAHDLRSPLSNLRMILDLLNKTSDQDKKNEFLNALNISVHKLDQTVNGLVKIIEIQSTDNSVFAHLPFKDVLAKVIEDLSHKFEEQKVVLVDDFSRYPEIKYIEAYLISIIKNIVGNALKYYSSKRPLEIRISSQKIDDFVLLSIADNGVGMDLLKYGKNIFKPFTRFSKIADGKGLGLYLVKNMVEKNGGKIEVESTIDVGTTFNIFLKEY